MTSTTTIADCRLAMIQGDEDCDDGNRWQGDACLNDCLLASCGDGILHLGVEDCVMAMKNRGDACLNIALSPNVVMG